MVKWNSGMCTQCARSLLIMVLKDQSSSNILSKLASRYHGITYFVPRPLVIRKVKGLINNGTP